MKIDALAQMWADYTSDYRRRMNDDKFNKLEEQAEKAKETQRTVTAEQSESAQKTSLFGGLLDNPMSLLPLAKGLVKGLFTKGLIGGALVLFADEITEAIGLIPGSFLSDSVQGLLIGGGIGLAFGGPIGGLIGAMVGAAAVVSKKLGDKVKEAAEGYGFDNATAVIMGEATSAVGNIAAGAAGGALVGGPIGAIVGALAGALLSAANLIVKYNTDEDFKKIVDDTFAKITGAVANVFNNIIDSLLAVMEGAKEMINAGLEKIGLGDLLITDAERSRAEAAMMQTDSGQESIQSDAAARAELERIAKQRATMNQLASRRDQEGLAALASELGLSTDGTSGQLQRSISATLKTQQAAQEALVDAHNDAINATLDSLGTVQEQAEREAKVAEEIAASKLSTSAQTALQDANDNIAQLEQKIKDTKFNRYTGAYSGQMRPAQISKIASLEAELEAAKQEKAAIIAPSVDASTNVTSAPQAINMGGAGANSTHNSYIAAMANAGIT